MLYIRLFTHKLHNMLYITVMQWSAVVVTICLYSIPVVQQIFGPVNTRILWRCKPGVTQDRL